MSIDRRQLTPRKPLRLWPGVVAVVAAVAGPVRRCRPSSPESRASTAMMWRVRRRGWLVVLWWLFFSRAPWSERAGRPRPDGRRAAARHRASSTRRSRAGMGPLLLVVYAIPVLCLALVAGAAASRRLSGGPRRASMAAAILLACGVWTLVRTGGDHRRRTWLDFHWRWTQTPEERLLARGRRRAGGAAVRPGRRRSAPAAPSAAPSPQPATRRRRPRSRPGNRRRARG